MEHWHRCERWTREGLPCPFSSLAQHDTLEEPDDDRLDVPPVPVGVPDLPPVVPPAKKAEAAKPTQRGDGTAAGVEGLWQIPLPPYERELLRPPPTADPEPVEPVGPIPVGGIRGVAPPRPPPLPAGDPAAEPYRNPFRNPAIQRAVGRARALASARGIQQATTQIPRLWVPPPRIHDVLGMPAAKAALAEVATAQTLGRQSEARQWRRGAVAAAIAGAATAVGIGAYKGRGGGGFGGFKVNMALRMRQLAGAPGARSYGFNYGKRGL